jgi:hypothetical protein
MKVARIVTGLVVVTMGFACVLLLGLIGITAAVIELLATITYDIAMRLMDVVDERVLSTMMDLGLKTAGRKKPW